MDIKSYILWHTAGNLYWKDKRGVYQGCNQNMAKVFKLKSTEEIIGKNDYDFFLEKEFVNKIRENDSLVLNQGIEQEFEEIGTNADGQLAIYLTKKSPIYNDDGKIIGLIGISFDISARKKMEEDLLQAKEKSEAASRAKSEFLANMSHDLRTPLTGILGMAQDMLYNANKIVKQKELSHKYTTHDLKQIIETVQTDSQMLLTASNQLLQLCNEILESVRLESPKHLEQTEAFDFKKLIEHNIELLAPVAKHKNLTLTYSIENNIPPYLIGIRSYLDRALLNLISNALKFTENGFVKVTANLADDNKTTSEYKPDDKIILQIVVEDSGIGIPQDKFKDIFERFSRLTSSYRGIYKGAGLGLYTVKHYISAMNGEIDVKSEIGKGTLFTLAIPFIVTNPQQLTDPIQTKEESNPAKYQHPTIPPHENHLQSKNSPILVVEDSPVIVMALKMALKQYDLECDVAINGAEAIQMIENGNYSLVLMDIGLPDLSGIEVTKQIRAKTDNPASRVPIVALTGHGGDPKFQHEALEAGMQAILNKPATPKELDFILQQYIFNS